MATLGLGSLLGAHAMPFSRQLTVAHDSAHTLAKGEGCVAGRHLLRAGGSGGAAENAALWPSRLFCTCVSKQT